MGGSEPEPLKYSPAPAPPLKKLKNALKLVTSKFFSCQFLFWDPDSYFLNNFFEINIKNLVIFGNFKAFFWLEPEPEFFWSGSGAGAAPKSSGSTTLK